ncbi:MAG: arsenosugar biosynthesis radical SAM (seleno)protein ArsS [Myxococcota bacterium]
MTHALHVLDVSGPRATQSLRARRSPLAPPDEQLARLGELAASNGYDFDERLRDAGHAALGPARLEFFQINLGKLCNMTCRHCHVDAGPDRTDANMDLQTVRACLRALDQTEAHTVDLTGGAPELNPHFRDLVDEVVARGKRVIDRCNLTVLLSRRMDGLAAWMAERKVEVVCSLPHYALRNTDAQRGDGTFEKSLRALRLLNDAGYGQGDPDRILTLMSNPAGAFLSGNQLHMEREWKRALEQRHGVTFDRLFALNNMPISRFLEWLEASGNTEAYMQRLANAFNPATVDGLMCRNTISISWDGYIYDCDFNQMLDMKVGDRTPMRIEDFDPSAFASRRIRTAPHCFGCTAGAGSSCGGATA